MIGYSDTRLEENGDQMKRGRERSGGIFVESGRRGRKLESFDAHLN